MRQIIENLGNNKKNQSSGDDEINPRPLVAKKRKQEEAFNADNFFDDAQEEIPKNSKKRIVESNMRRKVPEEIEDGKKRGVTSAIEKNRGITRSRPKDKKTPKTKLRSKYESKQKF